VLFLFYGTILTLTVSAIYQGLTNVSEQITSELLVVGACIVSIPIILLFVWLFTRLTEVLAQIDKLPHFFDGVRNRKAFAIGTPLLALAVVLEFELFDHDTFRLAITSIVSLILSLSIVLISVALRLISKSRKYRDNSVSFLLGCASVVIFLISVALVVVDFYLAIKNRSFGLLISILIVFFCVFLMLIIEHYYQYIKQELAINIKNTYLAHPTKVYSFVMVEKLNKPTIRAISFAKALHEDIEIVGIGNVENDYCSKLREQWETAAIPAYLRIYNSKTRDFSKGAYSFIKSIQLKSKHDLIVIYLPHYNSKHFYEKFLHNRISSRFEHQLNKLPNVVIASVPYQRS
jgi:hypothetical protein